ncbi:MAG TPA: GNAT family acetyltransferase [Thermoplasmata archaeon]|nr:GNAT family acetyltransferase [Thermoplasmata archaeon]
MRTNLGLRVRQYAPMDYRTVVKLWRSSGIHVGPSDSRQELERSRRRDADLFLVAEEDERIVGVVFGRYDGRRGWIHHLAVDVNRRRLGIGGKLVAELERRLARKGCAKVNLHVVPENETVCAFYEELGYGRRNLIFMDKWLRGPAQRKP